MQETKSWGFNHWVRRPPGRRQGNPHHYSCQENPMKRGAWRATVPRVSKSRTWLKGLNVHTHTCIYVKFKISIHIKFKIFIKQWDQEIINFESSIWCTSFQINKKYSGNIFIFIFKAEKKNNMTKIPLMFLAIWQTLDSFLMTFYTWFLFHWSIYFRKVVILKSFSDPLRCKHFKASW